MKFLRRLAYVLVAIGVCFLVARHLNRLPSLAGRTSSTAIFDTQDTRLGQLLAPLLAQHRGLSGIHPLADSREAFAARVRLAHLAQRTLDVQYYIWEDDMTGMLLYGALRAAAARGVRVRLLLDDNNTRGHDPILAALDAHPNIEIRLFNPFVIRKPRIGYITDFKRANRRMHNKSFTADTQATIIGGRNIGDAYFGAAEGLLFVDLDVIAVGPVVADVAHDFDRYWASESSYPGDRIIPPAGADELAHYAAKMSQVEGDPAAEPYIEAARYSPVISALEEWRLDFEWAKRREALLRAGVKLYEMKRLARETKQPQAPGSAGSSGSSLHAKTFAVDSTRAFVGSFNFDPRSRNLNTELGFVIESPQLSRTIESAFFSSIPANAYEVRLSESGELYWIDRRGDQVVHHHDEPGTSFWLRAAVWFLSLLPIDWLL